MQDIETNAVQQRIKKLMKQKKMAKQHQSVSQSQKRKRSVSQAVLQANENSLGRKQNQQQMSIRTQWKKRSGSQKYNSTQNSDTTNETLQKNRIDVQKIIQTIFIYSSKIPQYCQQYKLIKQQTLQQLLTDQLFILQLSNKLSRLGGANGNNLSQSISSTQNSIVQNEVILKLTKLNRKKRQSLLCYDVQNRIKSLINHRLDALKKY